MANGSNSRECRRVRERNSPRVSGAQCASNAVSFVAVGGTDREFIVDIGVRDAFTAFLAPLRKAEWVVYSKRPFGGPAAVLAYLARYTHRVAIANSRLIALRDGAVTFRWKDYRIKDRDRQRTMTLPVSEFIRRFLLHVLPSGFHRIRHYGLLASGARARNIARVRQLLTPAAQSNPNEAADDPGEPDPPNPYPCPCCGGRMIVVETFGRAGPSSSRIRIDTS